MLAHLPVGLPSTGRSIRGQCNVDCVAVIVGDICDLLPGQGIWLLIGLLNITLLGGRSLSLYERLNVTGWS